MIYFIIVFLYLVFSIIYSFNTPNDGIERYDVIYFTKYDAHIDVIIFLLSSIFCMIIALLSKDDKYFKQNFIIISIVMFIQFLDQLSMFVNSLSILWYKFFSVISIVQITYIVLLIYTIIQCINYWRWYKKEELMD